MNMAQILIVAGALPFIVLGLLHNIYTAIDRRKPFRISPSDPAVRTAMEGGRLKIHPLTNVWRAWIGFNFSHGLGAIVFGAIYLILALTEFEMLIASRPLMMIAAVTPLIYLWLAIRFWFVIPVVGIAIGTAGMVGAFALTM